MQLAPSKNPEKEGKTFANAGLICSIFGLFVWFFAIPGLAFSVRGIILSKRVGYKKELTMSVVGLILSLIGFGYFIATSSK